MNTLIVEDDENKRDQIGRFVADNFPAINISYARSLQSGLKAIIKESLDLIILDMTMPTFDITVDEDGGRPQAYAGREVLKQMDRRNIETPVIVVTQFDKFGEGTDALTLNQLEVQLHQSHPNSYRGLVYYDVAVEGWKDELFQMITPLITDQE